MAGITGASVAPIVYFDGEGKTNLRRVVSIVKKYCRKHSSLSDPRKLIITTGFGEGPLMAYHQLQEFEIEIIVVTFPPTFLAKNSSGELFNPQIPPKLRDFFNGVKIPVVTARLPFDPIDGCPAHNDQMKLIQNVLSLFGSSFYLLIQGVLQACDVGLVQPGELVLGMTGDCAAVITSSPTMKFLSKDGGLEINEILCKPRKFIRSQKKKSPATIPSAIDAPPVKKLE